MNMMNKCAKFHKDSPNDKKVKFNLPSAIELSETAVFVYNFVLKPYASGQLRWHIWPTFPLIFFYEIFTEDASLLLLYHGSKSQKWPKTQIKGGPALTGFYGNEVPVRLSIMYWYRPESTLVSRCDRVSRQCTNRNWYRIIRYLSHV